MPLAWLKGWTRRVCEAAGAYGPGAADRAAQAGARARALLASRVLRAQPRPGVDRVDLVELRSAAAACPPRSAWCRSDPEDGGPPCPTPRVALRQPSLPAPRIVEHCPARCRSCPMGSTGDHGCPWSQETLRRLSSAGGDLRAAAQAAASHPQGPASGLRREMVAWARRSLRWDAVAGEWDAYLSLTGAGSGAAGKGNGVHALRLGSGRGSEGPF